ncbi:hypothetical protein GBA52_026958 [Prunus armeniaca]|nr:hypothetical protein GBA52_026958 [Prunus armeniaca]
MEIGSQIKGIEVLMVILVSVVANLGIGSRLLVVEEVGEEVLPGLLSEGRECAGSSKVVTARRAHRAIICTRTIKGTQQQSSYCTAISHKEF